MDNESTSTVHGRDSHVSDRITNATHKRRLSADTPSILSTFKRQAKRRKTVTFSANLEQFRIISNEPPKPQRPKVSLDAYRARNAAKRTEQGASGGAWDPRSTAAHPVNKNAYHGREKSRQSSESADTIRRQMFKARVQMQERQNMKELAGGDAVKKQSPASTHPSSHAHKPTGQDHPISRRLPAIASSSASSSSSSGMPLDALLPSTTASSSSVQSPVSSASGFRLIPVTVQPSSGPLTHPTSSLSSSLSSSSSSSSEAASISHQPPYPHPHTAQSSHQRPHLRPAQKAGPRGYNNRPPGGRNSHHNSELWEFVQRVLQWNPAWLHEQEKFSEPPPVSADDRFCPLLETYDSYDDYCKIFKPLLFLETWQSITSDWKKTQEQRTSCVLNVAVTGMDNVNGQTMDLQFQALVSNSDRHMTEGDLVIMTLKFGKRGRPLQDQRVFGYVTSSRKTQPNRTPSLHTLLEQTYKQEKQTRNNIMVQTMFLRTRYRETLRRQLRDEVMMTCQTIGSLVNAVRQFKALSFLRHSPLATHLLRPADTSIFTPNANALNIDLNSHNPSQIRAIHCAVAASLQPASEPSICMIQGPPGTGKTNTILKILELLTQSERKQHILLCAPSNAAIDELTRRLIALRHSLQNNQRQSRFRIVRLGHTSSMHPVVKPYSLDELVKTNIAKKVEREMSDQMQSVRSDLEKLNKELDSLHQQRALLCANGQENRIRQLDREIKRLQNRKQQFDSRNRQGREETRRNERAVQREVIANADVVCCTLSGSGGHMLSDSLPAERATSTPHFTSVIIDEACQSIEADSLIPLQYGCSKLILVGDPYQLQPTVLSKKATDLNYNQSLFERLFHFLKWQPVNPVFMLDTQYRMHPEICAFPAAYVYNGILKTHPSVTQRGGVSLQPYKLFDVEQSIEEENGPGSLWNDVEASFVCELCRQIQETSRGNVRVAVVTPYQKHRAHLTNKLRTQGLNSMEVNTVDSFQGQEKDVIVMSCVRAQNANKGIGFVADLRRLNVSLTRAKHALYVVGNLKTLMVDSDWKALISDGHKRELVVRIRGRNAHDFGSQIKSRILMR